MARSRTYKRLKVILNGRLVGLLSRQSSGAIDFTYDSEWLGWEGAIPASRSLPLRAERYVGAPVLAVFENLLPDGDAIRTRIAERTGAAGTDAYSLLSEIGRDCVGALQFVPEDQVSPDASTPKGEALCDNDIAELLRSLKRAPLGIDRERDFRISLAGAQDKTALLRKDGSWLRPLGATPTTHILKPAIGKLENGLDLSFSIENEFVCMRLLAALGLPVAQVEMHEFVGVKALVIERFDRRQTRDGRLLRLPQEDMCQALGAPPTRKYQSEGGPGIVDILTLLKESDTPEADQKLFLKAQLAFWMIGATDGHAKNFSIFLSPGGRFRLTPLYDVLSLLPNHAARELSANQMKLAMSVGKNRHYALRSISTRHFAETAAKAGVRAALVEEAFAEIRANAHAAIAAVDQVLTPRFPAKVHDPIFEALLKATV